MRRAASDPDGTSCHGVVPARKGVVSRGVVKVTGVFTWSAKPVAEVEPGASRVRCSLAHGRVPAPTGLGQEVTPRAADTEGGTPRAGTEPGGICTSAFSSADVGG